MSFLIHRAVPRQFYHSPSVWKRYRFSTKCREATGSPVPTANLRPSSERVCGSFRPRVYLQGLQRSATAAASIHASLPELTTLAPKLYNVFGSKSGSLLPIDDQVRARQARDELFVVGGLFDIPVSPDAKTFSRRGRRIAESYGEHFP